MKKKISVICFLFISYFATAQDTIKQKELGIVFYDLDNFGFTFKIGNNKSLWRLNNLLMIGEKINFDSSSSYTKNFFGIRGGKEFRKSIVKNLEMRYGTDVSFRYYRSNSTDNNTSTKRIIYQPGINLVFGLNYLIHENFIFGAEILPGFSYLMGKETQSTINDINLTYTSYLSGFYYGLSNSSVLLSLVYKLK